MLEVVTNRSHPRPPVFTDDLWSLVTACLTFVPSQRPNVEQILDLLRVRNPPPGYRSLFALVIGIDEYADPNMHDLTGAVADADAVKDFLQKTLHVPESQIKNLRNKDATRVTIEEEIKNLGDNPAIKKDDPILIFYAGREADVTAPPGWPTGSADRKMKMLVPHDFIKGGSDDIKRGQGVLDVRLSHLFQDVAVKKSDNIVRSHTFLSHMVSDHVHRQTVILDCGRESEKPKKGKRGVFTSALLEVLEQHKDRIDKLTYKDVIDNLDLPEE